MRYARLDELQAGIKMGRRNIKHLRYADDTTLMAGSKQELKSLLMRVKVESERAYLKLNIKKGGIWPHYFMLNRRGKGGSSDRFPLLGLCSHEIRRQLLHDKKAMTNGDSVEKQKHYSDDKDLYSQGYGLPSGHVRLCELDSQEGRVLKN